MATGPILKSALKAAADKFPGQMKAQSVVPMLKKQGVKDEELTFSTVGQTLQDAGADRVSRDVLEAPSGFGEEVKTGSDTLYNWVSLDEGVSNPTYKERIITFGEQGRYQSNHFPDDNMGGGPSNYLMHNRVFDRYDGTSKSRVLQEIQSDLHQQGRQRGYSDPAHAELVAKLDAVRAQQVETIVGDATEESVEALAREAGWDESAGSVNEWLRVADSAAGAAPRSPWEKTWLKKGIELEVADAVEKNMDQLEIPISGAGTGMLQRAAGVDKWYETNVTNTAKKIAKSMGGEFELRQANLRLI